MQSLSFGVLVLRNEWGRQDLDPSAGLWRRDFNLKLSFIADLRYAEGKNKQQIRTLGKATEQGGHPA